MDTLRDIFFELAGNYSTDKQLMDQYWNEIELCHSEPHRHYHNLHHLESLIEVLSPLKEDVDDWNTILFSIYYHDIIYDPTKRDNEEQSAILAVKRLTELGVSTDQTSQVEAYIKATKNHEGTTSIGMQYFVDADLSILGHCDTVYINYSKAIRAEYSIYPDELYLPGRLKVVEHFLSMPDIFKTPYFKSTYEAPARENLRREKEELMHQ